MKIGLFLIVFNLIFFMIQLFGHHPFLAFLHGACVVLLALAIPVKEEKI